MSIVWHLRISSFPVVPPHYSLSLHVPVTPPTDALASSRLQINHLAKLPIYVFCIPNSQGLQRQMLTFGEYSCQYRVLRCGAATG